MDTIGAGVLADLDPPGPNPLANMDPPGTYPLADLNPPQRIWTPNQTERKLLS